MIRAAKLCACGGIVQDKCDRCGKANGSKPTAHRQGYDKTWQRWRRTYIQTRIEQGTFYCDDCRKLFTPQLGSSPELHHIIKVSDCRQAMYDKNNILMLHHDCHSKRTARGE